MALSTEFRVNSWTTNDQDFSKITRLADGGWVVTWTSDLQDLSSNGIYSQAYNADGSLRGAETQINTETSDNQYGNRVTALSDGGWVVAWVSMNQDGDLNGVYFQAYNADGTTQGSETLANTYTTGRQRNAEVTSLESGGWLVTWTSEGQVGGGFEVYAQAYTATGALLGTEFRVNTTTTSSQYSHKSISLADGGWVTTWTSYDQDGSGAGTYQQAYDSDGTTRGSETRVNTATTGDQYLQEIVALSDGGWVVVWRHGAVGVYAQIYNADATAQGSEITIDTTLTNSLFGHRLASLSDGGWIVTWVDYGGTADESDVYFRVFNADGTTRTSKTLVNTYTLEEQDAPEIHILPDGGWIIAWESDQQDGYGTGIYAQVYNSDGTTRGSEFRVNADGTYAQGDLQIASVGTAGWVITWTDGDKDGDDNGIYARTFAAIDPNDVTLTISGTQEVGETLTAGVTGIDLTDPTLTILYEWRVDGILSISSSANTYLLTNSDTGAVITVTLVISDTLFADPTIPASTGTDPIYNENDLPTGDITLSSSNATPDRYDIGDTITSLNTLADADGLGTLTYTWLRDGEAIAGADAATYLLTTEDRGRKIILEISYTDDAGYDAVIATPKIKVVGRSGETFAGTALVDTTLGTQLDDDIYGDDGNDRLLGRGGHDKIYGGKDDDTLTGGTGRDLLKGGGGEDVLLGNADADRLFGDGGDDILTGGAGRDRFIFKGNTDNDTITDFDDTKDLIKLEGIDFATSVTVATSGDDVLVTHLGGTVLLLDTDIASITADDFLFFA